MTEIPFKDVPEFSVFTFGELDYMKTEKDKGLSLAGARTFNPQETVTFPVKINGGE